jgi:hypothetical protein
MSLIGQAGKETPCRWRWVDSFGLRKRKSVPSVSQDLWQRPKYLAHPGTRTPNRAASSLVTTLTELHRVTPNTFVPAQSGIIRKFGHNIPSNSYRFLQIPRSTLCPVIVRYVLLRVLVRFFPDKDRFNLSVTFRHTATPHNRQSKTNRHNESVVTIRRVNLYSNHVHTTATVPFIYLTGSPTGRVQVI